jgi:DNA-binding transcriptional regulator YdaS (Cro superfamily)
MKEQPHVPALREAIKVMGNQTALAKAIGKEQGHIWFWLKRAQKIPPTIAIKIEQATDGKVSRDRLCPELSPEYQP